VTWWRASRGPGRPAGDPFAVLGLSPTRELTDDDVRVAWRRIAAATHPDRADGGDPARFAGAAAAYTTLRTRSGRGEALADAAAPVRRRGLAGARATAGPASGTGPAGARATAGPASGTGPAGALRVKNGISRAWPGTGALSSGRWAGRLALLVTRIRRGRPGRLALRVLAAGAASAAAVAVAGSRPAGPALVTGAVTWLLLTARRDLAPPR
jgi:curved DNA-binding protein CbpA